MVKLIALFFLVSLFVSCTHTVDDKDDKLILLQEGTWLLKNAKRPLVEFQKGLKFSPNNKLFYVDSQGYIVPTHNDIYYSLDGDTLRFVDHKYLKEIRFEKGTHVFLIDKLSEDSLVLQLLHPKDNRLIYIKVDK